MEEQENAENQISLQRNEADDFNLVLYCARRCNEILSEMKWSHSKMKLLANYPWIKTSLLDNPIVILDSIIKSNIKDSIGCIYIGQISEWLTENSNRYYKNVNDNINEKIQTIKNLPLINSLTEPCKVSYEEMSEADLDNFKEVILSYPIIALDAAIKFFKPDSFYSKYIIQIKEWIQESEANYSGEVRTDIANKVQTIIDLPLINSLTEPCRISYEEMSQPDLDNFKKVILSNPIIALDAAIKFFKPDSFYSKYIIQIKEWIQESEANYSDEVRTDIANKVQIIEDKKLDKSSLHKISRLSRSISMERPASRVGIDNHMSRSLDSSLAR